MKVVVYTALIGNIDKLWSALPESANVRHIAFVDAHKTEVGLWGGSPPKILAKTGGSRSRPIWEQRIIKPEWDTRRTARHYKALPHRYLPDADVWIWVDANVRLRAHPLKFIKRRMIGDLVTFTHWDRRCLYAEASFCAKVHKDRGAILKAQMARYRKAGMPSNWGLAATRVVIRRNTQAIHKLNDSWWKEIERGSVRDQVSLPYVCWKHKLRWKSLPGRCDPRNTSTEYWCIRHARKKRQ